MIFKYYSQMLPVAVRHVCVFATPFCITHQCQMTSLECLLCQEDHCLLRVVPSLLGKSFSFILGARERPWNQFRDLKEAWEPVPGLVEAWNQFTGSKEAWEPVLGLQEAWKYFFNPLPVLEHHTSGHDMTLCNKSKSNLQTTTWNSFFNSITFLSHKRSELRSQGKSQPLAIDESCVVEEQPFEEVHRYSPQPTTPFPGW